MENNTFPPFYVGQRVVALYDFYYIVKGQEYIVKAIQFGYHACYPEWSVDVGIGHTVECYKCGEILKDEFVRAVHFAPVDEMKEFKKITYSEVLEEVDIAEN